MKVKITFFMLMVLVFTGCCPKLTPQSISTTITHDTIVRTMIRDTIIIIPGNEVKINSGVNCDSLHRAQMKKEVIKKDGLTETVEIKDGQLTATCSEDSLKLLLKLKDKQINILKAVTTKEVDNVEVWKMHWWEKLFFWMGVTSLGYIVFRIVIRFYFPGNLMKFLMLMILCGSLNA